MEQKMGIGESSAEYFNGKQKKGVALDESPKPSQVADVVETA